MLQGLSESGKQQHQQRRQQRPRWLEGRTHVERQGTADVHWTPEGEAEGPGARRQRQMVALPQTDTAHSVPCSRAPAERAYTVQVGLAAQQQVAGCR